MSDVPTRPAASAAGRVRRCARQVGFAAVLVAVVLVGMVLVTVASAGPALAHATLTSSSPADGAVLASAPSSVQLTFDEAVRPVAAQVIDPAGRNAGGDVVGHGATVSIALRAAAQGTYTVSWRVVSADSHPITGAITFSVGHPSGPATVATTQTRTAVSSLFAVARFLGFAGFALLVGAVAFCCYGYRGGMTVRGVRLSIKVGVAALAAGTVGALVLQGPYAAGAGLGAVARTELLRQTLATTYGTALIVRILLVGLAIPLLAHGLPRLGTGTAGRAGRAAFCGAGALMAAGLAVTWSVAGHPRTGAQPVLAMCADATHLCAMALWLGGLAVVPIVLRSPDPAVADGVARFSTVAAGCVATLAATGLYQSWLRVQDLSALSATSYGVALVVKVVLVCAVLGVAFFSRRVVRGRRRTGTLPPRLGRYVAAEAGGALVILAVTALLVEMEPAGKALAARPATLTAHYDTHGVQGAGSLSLRLPNRARGLSGTTLDVRDAAGRPRDVLELRVTWSLPARAIGPVSARIGYAGTGRYTVVTAPLTAAGRWRIAVTVRTGDVDETTVYLSETLR